MTVCVCVCYLDKPTMLLAMSLSLQGSLLVLWLMALLLMCLGRAPNTWELPVVLVTAVNMAFTSAARALANAEAEETQQHTSQKLSRSQWVGASDMIYSF